MPGVTSVVAAMVPVLAGDNWGNSLGVEGFEAGPDTNTNASFNGVGPGYFKTMGIPLMMGREFTRADAFGAPKVAIVNQAFVQEVQPRRQRRSASASASAADRHQARHRDRRRRAGRQVQRREARRAAAVLPAVPAGRAARLRATSTSAPRCRPSSCCRPFPRVMRKLDASLPLGDIKTMETQIRENVVAGPHHQHAVAGVCGAGDRAGGDRPLRRAGLHGGAAHARVRPAHGARRRRRRGARHGDEAGRRDGDRRRRRSAWRSRSASAGWPSRCCSRWKGYDPVVLTAATVALGARRARRRVPARRCARRRSIR